MLGGLDLSFVNWEIISKFVANGFFFSVQLTIVATLGGIFFGTLLALMRLSGKKAFVVPATVYVNGMRSIPLVMVILWFFLLIPLLTGRPLGAELSAIITFTVFEAAYYSEIMRAGIQSVPHGQFEAASSLGLGFLRSMQKVVLPQAIRNVVPDLISNTLEVVKLTSIASVVALPELLYAARQVQSVTYNASPVIAAGLLYLLLLWPLVRLLSRYERKAVSIR